MPNRGTPNSLISSLINAILQIGDGSFVRIRNSTVQNRTANQTSLSTVLLCLTLSCACHPEHGEGSAFASYPSLQHNAVAFLQPARNLRNRSIRQPHLHRNLPLAFLLALVRNLHRCVL